jgi:hypothetical protein
MEYCKKCRSIWFNGKCSNVHCGRKVIMWARTDPDYKADIKEGKPLIHAIRHNSPQVQAMGLHPSEPIEKQGYHLYM